MKEDYLAYARDHAKLAPFDSNLTSNHVQSIKCLLCNNTFKAATKGKINNFKQHGIPGCASCTKKVRYNDIIEANIKTIEAKFTIHTPNIREVFNNNLMIDITNNKCNHRFIAKTGNILNRDVNCPTCNTLVKSELMSTLSEEQHIIAYARKQDFDAYSLRVSYLTRKSYTKYKHIINPKNYSRVLAKEGNIGYHLDHIMSKKYCFLNSIPPEICADHRNLRMAPWRENITKHSKPLLQPIPSIFFKYLDVPKKMNNFITTLNDKFVKESIVEFVDEDGTIFTIKLNDVYVLYCCFSDYKQQIILDRKYLVKIYNKMIAAGKRCVIIFEDEFAHNRELVISKIGQIINANTYERIHGRKCEIIKIDNNTKNKFLNTYHLQGTCVSQINLGAYYNKELVAVMTFSKPRVLMSKKLNAPDTYELARFATNVNYRVVGIASKLLSHFKKNNKWQEIYSYADKRWSVGNLYTTIGFELIVNNEPEYWYIINEARKHRWGYRKDAIKDKFPEVYDANTTEYQMMLSLGYDRIWDCGTLKYAIFNEHY